MLYAAYGSNLNVFQMQHRCPDAEIVTKGFLDGYRLMFKGSKTGSYLTVEREAGCKVPIGIWRVSDRDLHRLDMYEGYPNFYYRKQILVPCEDGRRHRALIYIMHEDHQLGMPDQYYINTCEQGYKDFGFDQQYLLDAVQYTIGGAA